MNNKGKTHRPPRCPNYPIRRIGPPVGAGYRPPVRSIENMISEISMNSKAKRIDRRFVQITPFDVSVAQ